MVPNHGIKNKGRVILFPNYQFTYIIADMLIFSRLIVIEEG